MAVSLKSCTFARDFKKIAAMMGCASAKSALFALSLHHHCTRFRKIAPKVDPLAQSVEHNTFNVGVLGSSPKRITSLQEKKDTAVSFFCLPDVYSPINFRMVLMQRSLLTGFDRKSLHPASRANWRSLSKAFAVKAIMGRSG